MGTNEHKTEDLGSFSGWASLNLFERPLMLARYALAVVLV